MDADRDGCSTRAQVLIVESLVALTAAPGRKVTAGEWRSYYDGVTVPGGLVIDHMIPLGDTERGAVVRLADECDGWEVAHEPAP